MSSVIIFGGTTEGRKLSEFAAENGYCVELYVATGFGKDIIDTEKHSGISVHVGRLDLSGMKECISAGKSETVIDATHPYASEVSINIKKACEDLDKEYIRCIRKSGMCENGEYAYKNTVLVSGVGQACEIVNRSFFGNILATTGSKEIEAYAEIENYKNRVFARVLPFEESIAACRRAGIRDENIIAKKGPFTADENMKMIDDFGIDTLITKDGGKEGGFSQKMTAVKKCGINIIVVKKSVDESGVTFEDVKEILIGRKLKQF